VRTGLTKDDWLVTRGLARARPGTKVNARREGAGGPQGAAAPGSPPQAKTPPPQAPQQPKTQ
jgi:hypothetical protein